MTTDYTPYVIIDDVTMAKVMDIVEQARLYIHNIGGFEKFAMWGLVRPLAQV